MRTLRYTSAAVLFAFLPVAAGAAAQQSSNHALLVNATWTATHVAQESLPGDGVRRITPEEVRAALAKGEAVIVDVRGEGSFEVGHIKGAINMPTDKLLSRVSELPRDKTIITYCS